MELLNGLLLGAAYVLPPGPVLIETVRRGLRGSTPAALAVQLGAIAGDLCYAALMLGGLGALLRDGSLQQWLSLAGALVLVGLGVSTLRDRSLAALTAHADTSDTVNGTHAAHLGAGLALGLLNPFAVAFWLSVGGSVLGEPATLAGFVTGCVLASLLTALVAGQLQRPLWRRCARLIGLGCGLALVVLGVQLGFTALPG